MAQVSNLPTEYRLGQEARDARTLEANVLAYVAEIHNVASLADEIGHFAPASRAADVVVRERDDAGNSQVVTELDHAVPQCDPVPGADSPPFPP
jgi:hypothetical protein